MTRELASKVRSGKEGSLEEVQEKRALKTGRRESGCRNISSAGKADRQPGKRHSLQGCVLRAFQGNKEA